VLTTKHFAFYSDLATTVNDALVAAASARLSKQAEPFAEGPAKACLGWSRRCGARWLDTGR
jgi:hypothetical protein